MDFRLASLSDENRDAVRRLRDASAIRGLGDERKEDRREGKHQKENTQKGTASEYFDTLVKATANANDKLAAGGMPFRFCVYRTEERVFIDIVRLDSLGKVAATTTKDITDDDFGRWIEDIASIEGLFFDRKG